jgi:hypothetical protein
MATPAFPFRQSILEPPPDAVVRGDLDAALRDWLGDAGGERHFVIGGLPGAGKSTALAGIVARWRETLDADDVAIAHFCVPGDLETRSPIGAAEALALQLVTMLDGYVDALVRTSSDAGEAKVEGIAKAETVNGTQAGVLIERFVLNSSAEDAWRRLIVAPLRLLYESGCATRLMVVLDGLDEADRYDGAVKLGDLVAGMPFATPLVRLVLGTRDGQRLKRRLGGDGSVCVWDLSAGAGREESERALRTFLGDAAERLAAGGRLAADVAPAAFADAATSRSDGSFLYARLLVGTIEARATPFALADLAALPDGLDHAYAAILEQVAGDEDDCWIGRYEPILGTLCAAREPLTTKQLAVFSGLAPVALGRALNTLRPLLAVEEGRHRLSHVTFRDYLVDPEAAGDWRCDVAGAHGRIVDSYRRATGDWREDGWDAVDAYGLRHVVAHARLAVPRTTSAGAIATAGFLRAVARQDQGLGAVDAQLRLLLDDAAEGAHPAGTLRWAWIRHRLRAHLAEQLVHGAAPILVRAGRTAAAWASLSALDPAGWEAGSGRTNLVTALARDGLADLALAVAADAPDTGDERGSARAELALAGSLVMTDPERAIALVGDAPRGHTTALCGALAIHPAHVDDAWRLATRDAEAQHAVVRAVAAHDLERAVALADRVGAVDERDHGEVVWRSRSAALADACLVAVDYAPRRVEALLTSAGLAREDVTLVAFALAARGDPESDAAIAWAREEGARSHVLGALLDAAWRQAPPAKDLGPGEACIDGHRYDVPVLARLPLERVRDRPEAAARVRDILLHIVGNLAVHPFEKPPGGYAALAAAVALVDVDAAVALARDAARLPLTSPPTLHQSAEAIVARLTPVDPNAAWSVVEQVYWHGCLLEWCRAIGADRWTTALARTAAVPRQSTTTRVALAGALADHCDAADQAANAALFRLLPHPTDSTMLSDERALIEAALRLVFAAAGESPHGLANVSGQPYYVDAQTMLDQADVITAARRGDPIEARVRRIERPEARLRALYLAGPDTAAPDLTTALVHAADRLALEPHPVSRLLGDAISVLAPLAPDTALQLVPCADDPTLLPLSAHQPTWIGVNALLQRVCAAYRAASLPLARFAERILERAEMMARPDAAVDLDRLLDAAAPSQRAELAAWIAAEHPELEPTLDAHAPIDEAKPALRSHRLRRLAAQDPEAAVAACIKDPHMLRHSLGGVLAQVAQASPKRALDLHCVSDWTDAREHDTLQAIARVIADTDWDEALRIVMTLPYDNARGLALFDLAAVAGADRPAMRRARFETLAAVGAQLDGYGREYVVRGLLAALLHCEPDPTVLAQTISLASSLTDFQHQLGDVTVLIAKAQGPASVIPALADVERILDALA